MSTTPFGTQLLATATIALTAPLGAQGLTWIESPVTGNWYATTAAQTWSDANATAQSLGVHLATIADPAENDWIASTFAAPGSPNAWIGFTDAADEGTWVWVTAEPVTFVNWSPPAPNDVGNEDGGNIVIDSRHPKFGTWEDTKTSELLPAIYETSSTDCDENGVPDAVQVAQGGTDPCLSLSAGSTSVSLSAGGSQVLTLTAGLQPVLNFYLLLGTLSGASPGLPLDQYVLPLNPDDYFLYTLQLPNSAVHVSTFGVLPPSGTATASINLPPGLNPALAGFTMHHAYLVIDATTDPANPYVSITSNAVPLDLLP